MNITEDLTWKNRRLTVTWCDAPFLPPRELITQASGLCFTDEHKIVLVSTDGETWQLVGSHPEASEAIEDAQPCYASGSCESPPSCSSA